MGCGRPRKGSLRWAGASIALYCLASLMSLPSLSGASGIRRADSDLLVELDARDASGGSAIWASRGSLGAFEVVGSPRRETVGGAPAVTFDGKADAYRGPKTSAALEGRAPRTIEVWAYNPALDADEEAMVSWGKRGGPDGSLIAFGWGRNAAYGAVAHWAADLGWNGPPKAGRWHFLVYTYDGRTARVYDNGVEKQSRAVALRSHAGTSIILGAETNAQGSIQFKNEFTGGQQAGSLSLSVVRVRAGALSPEQIQQAFDADAARFHASREDVAGFAAKGVEKFNAGELSLGLVKGTGTAAFLSPTGTSFDFTPGDRLTGRASDGYNHLGDCNLRVRTQGGPWQSFSTAKAHTDIRTVEPGGALDASDLTPALGQECPVDVRREWRREGRNLVLRFHIKNRTGGGVEMGAFGAPMVFNNLLTGRSLDDTHDKCSFADPSIAGPGGYLQVTRLNGQGPALLVLPEAGTSFEAYRPLYDDPTQREVTFEGFYEWMSHTRAYAENEWRAAQPWNEPTSRLLKPGEEAVYGFRFVLSPTIRAIEETLIKYRRPVAVGIPGYVVPADQTARLFLHSASPVRSIQVEPQNAVHIVSDAKPTKNGWQGYTLRPAAKGRLRLQYKFADGSWQTVHYFFTPSPREQLRKLGQFHAEKQWFTDPADPFHRTNSFLPFNREANKMVLQHSHSWFVGLSDEIGAGASVAVAMKNLLEPEAKEVALLEKYATTTLWGRVQNPDYSVRASLFYYQPPLHPGYYTVRGGWDKARTETTWRSFNYPHVAAVYWSLYHLARDHKGLTKEQTWEWYLDRAYRTAMGMKRFAPGYAQVGLMVGSVFPEILKDLRREGWTEKAADLEAFMRGRERRWETLRYPFGSEMPWDSTGQEEIYTWTRFFGADEKANVTLSAILGYMPTVPHWAYNGAARRYFDAPVNGTRWPQIVRMTNHYGSSLNSIPVLDSFRRSPKDLHLLRVGYAGMSQVLANIDAEGFASYGFDCEPAILQFDPYTADYGIAFYGYAHGAGTYVMRDAEFGLLGFGGEVKEGKGRILVTPRDGVRKRVFLAEQNLWLTLEAGEFERVEIEKEGAAVTVVLAPDTPDTPRARLRVETGSEKPSDWAPAQRLEVEREAYVIKLSGAAARVVLRRHTKGERSSLNTPAPQARPRGWRGPPAPGARRTR